MNTDHNVDANSIHPNLALARELVESNLHLLDSARPEDFQITSLLEDGGDDELSPLPGDNLIDIRANLEKAVSLCLQEVPQRAKGRNRQAQQWSRTQQRQELLLITQVCLKLLDAPAPMPITESIDLTQSISDVGQPSNIYGDKK